MFFQNALSQNSTVCQTSSTPIHSGRPCLYFKQVRSNSWYIIKLAEYSFRYTSRLFICEQEEVNKMIESYQKIDDKYALFEQMFLTIFLEQEVEMAYSFGLENLNEQQLKVEQKFRTHVGKFQRFITGILVYFSKKKFYNIFQESLTCFRKVLKVQIRLLKFLGNLKFKWFFFV